MNTIVLDRLRFDVRGFLLFSSAESWIAYREWVYDTVRSAHARDVLLGLTPVSGSRLRGKARRYAGHYQRRAYHAIDAACRAGFPVTTERRVSPETRRVTRFVRVG